MPLCSNRATLPSARPSNQEYRDFPTTDGMGWTMATQNVNDGLLNDQPTTPTVVRRPRSTPRVTRDDLLAWGCALLTVALLVFSVLTHL